MVKKFLEFLARDIERRPEALVELDEAFAADRVPRRGVARGVEVTTISGRPESVRLP